MKTRRLVSTFEHIIAIVAVLACVLTNPLGAEDQVNSFAERFSFRGRLHPQFDYLKSDLVGDGISSSAKTAHLFMRRVQVGMKYDFSESVRLNYYTDISDRVVKNRVARLEVKLSEQSSLHLGYQKVPFVHEDTTSSSKVKPSRAFNQHAVLE